MKDAVFTYSQERLQSFAEDVLRYARKKGADSAGVSISESTGLSVGVRRKKIETLERHQDKGIGVTVYMGKQRGNATTSDFSTEAMQMAVEAACNIARYTAQDEAAGLPDSEMLERHPRDLQLYYPWLITADEAVDIATRCEAAAFAVNRNIRNSEGANVNVQQAHFVSADSQGFMGGYPYSSHSISVSPIAGKGEHMQRDYWYSAKRNHAELASPEAIGEYAAKRALARLHARRLDTMKCAVLFEAPLATGLLGTYVQATSGGALYRQSSFLPNSLGTQVFPEHISMMEDPHVIGAMGSAPFDDEGVRTVRREVVKAGVVQGYFLSSYSARRLGMQTTGNAGGPHNLRLYSSGTRDTDDFAAMLKKLDTGLLVTDLMGQGINMVTGDYSRGASGFWVEKGEIQYPVQEITIAGNLKEMFQQIVAVGNDTITRGSRSTGSILIESMMIGGN